MNTKQQATQLNNRNPKLWRLVQRVSLLLKKHHKKQHKKRKFNPTKKSLLLTPKKHRKKYQHLANEDEPAENVSTPDEENEVVAIKSGKKKGKEVNESVIQLLKPIKSVRKTTFFLLRSNRNESTARDSCIRCSIIRIHPHIPSR